MSKKKLAVNLLVSLAAITAMLIITEVVMRFAWEMGGWLRRPIYQKSDNPFLRYELVPGSSYGHASVNSLGFRGREYQVAKPENTFRIVMIGDSETLSFLLKPDETLAAQLEGLLNKQSASLHYEVLNFGVEGYCTLQELELLRTKALKYDPNLIILNYCLNDPEPGEYYLNKNFLMRHSALARYTSYRIKKGMIRRERKKLGISDELENYNYYYQPRYFNHVKEAILEMAAIAKTQNNKLVVVIFPTSSTQVKDFKQNYPYKHLHRKVLTIDASDIVFIDLTDEFNRRGMTPQEVSINYAYDESHKNPAALGVSAEYIAAILKSEGIINRK